MDTANPYGFCAHATCRSDEDCAPGKLCVSAGLGYVCRTANDTCASDADCTDEVCTWTGDRFGCVPRPTGPIP